MADAIGPPPWQEPPTFNLPCVPKPSIPLLPCAIPVLVHGVDGETLPELPASYSDPILQFHYEPSSVVGEHATEESVFKVASNLLKFLVTNMENNDTITAKALTNKFSFMYFAYDFGGLVVKQALVIAAVEEQYRSIFNQTSLVVFYGTPHQPSSSQTWDANALRSLQFCFKGLLDSWVPSFIENASGSYYRLNETFKELAPEFCVLNICQQSKSLNYDLITEPSCALIGIEREEQRTLKDRSHYQLGRIVGQKEQEYMEEKMLDAAIYHWRIYHQFIDILRLQCHTTPAPLRTNGSYQQWVFKLFLSKSDPCTWKDKSSTTKTRLALGDNISFEEFLCLFSNHVLMADDQKKSIIFGLGRDHPSGTPLTLCQLYASLCLQLLDQQPSLLLWVRHLYTNVRDSILGGDNQWKVRSLARCLRTLLLTPKRGTVYCLIDYDTKNVDKLHIINEILSVMEESEISHHLLISTPPETGTESAVLTDCSYVDLSTAKPAGEGLKSRTSNGSTEHQTQRWAKFVPKIQLPSTNEAFVLSPNGPSIPSTWNLNLKSPEQILSACASNGMVWILRAISWISCAIRPLSRAEVEQALEVIYIREVSIQENMGNSKALLHTLEYSLSGSLSISKDAVEALPQLKQCLESIWSTSSNEGITPEIYIAQTCFAIAAAIFKQERPAEAENSAATSSNYTHHSSISNHEPQNAQPSHQSPRNAIEAYATRYWMEHQFRASSDINTDERFRQLLRTQPFFDQTNWINYLIKSNWSSDIDVGSTSKFLPESLQKNLELGQFQASYISFRIATLPLGAEDNLDWVFLEIASKLLPDDEYFKVVLKVAETLPDAYRTSTLQRVIASSPDNLRTQFLADLDDGDYLRDHCAELLLTSIAIGNTNAVRELLPQSSALSIKHKAEDASVRYLGTALQVACEYGDEGTTTMILNLKDDDLPFSLEKSYQWSALHVACHQGHSCIVRKLLKDGNYKLLEENASSQFNPLLVGSVRGLFDVINSLKPLSIEIPMDDEKTLSAIQLASKYGFSNTLETLVTTLVTSYGYKMTSGNYENNALLLAIRSGKQRAIDHIFSGLDDALERADNGSDAHDILDAFKMILRNATLVLVEWYQPGLDTWLLRSTGWLGEAVDSQGRTPLMISAMMGSLKLVQILGLRGSSSVDKSKRTAMHYACLNGHLDVVKLLAEDKSVKLTTMDENQNTPITAAARGSYQKVVEFLLPRISDEDRKAEFILAAKYGLQRTLSLILDHSADTKSKARDKYVNTKDNDSNTPLYYAARNNHPRVVQFLISRGANLGAVNKTGITPLSIAASRSSLESMKLLLDAGASPETPIRRGRRSVLTDAILFERESSTKLLLDYGALPRLPDYWMRYGNLLRFTLACSSLEVLKILLTYFNETRKSTGVGPLREEIPTPTEASRDIIKECRVDQLEVLLQVWDETKFDTNMFEEGLPIGPLFHYVARYGRASMLKLLCERSELAEKRLKLDEECSKLDEECSKLDGERSKCIVNINEIKGYYGTALQAAISSGRYASEKVATLIDWGAEVHPNNDREIRSLGPGEENAAALYGCWGTALHAAVASKDMEVLNLILLKQGGTLKDQRDKMGRLPLHVAALFSSWETVQNVLSPTSTIISEDYQGRNVLHMACGVGNKRMVENILQELGEPKDQIDKGDADGWTALHWACRSRHTDLINLLIGRGANIQAKANRPHGWLPYHVAIYYHWEPERFGLDRLRPSNSKPESPMTIEPGTYTDRSCVSCLCAIYGDCYTCTDRLETCALFDLCSKCFEHKSEIHFPDHIFERRKIEP